MLHQCKRIITNWKQKLGKTKHAGNPERMTLESTWQRKRAEIERYSLLGKVWRNTGKILPQVFWQRNSSLGSREIKNAPGINAERGVWWLMAICHLISSECSYHRGSRYENALIYWKSVLGKHVIIVLIDMSNTCTSQNVNKICNRFIQLMIFVSYEKKECCLRVIRLPYQNPCSFK